MSVLGLKPALGRWFTGDEDRPGGAAVAVIGQKRWTAGFDTSPSVLGQTIWVDTVPVTVVGVAPAGYNSSINPGIVTDY